MPLNTLVPVASDSVRPLLPPKLPSVAFAVVLDRPRLVIDDVPVTGFVVFKNRPNAIVLVEYVRSCTDVPV